MEYPKDSLNPGQTEDGFSNLKSIKKYRGLHSLSDPEYLGSDHNLSIEWGPGEITWVPLTNIMADFKHCRKFKVSFVTDGNHAKEPTETVYSRVVSLRNLRMAMFLSQLNNLQQGGANVGNAPVHCSWRRI